MISRETIEGLASLARLELSVQELDSLQKDISSILEYVGQVSAVDTSAVQEVPLVHNVMRSDALRGESDLLAGKEEVVRAAFPERQGDYNAVRKILQKDA